MLTSRASRLRDWALFAAAAITPAIAASILGLRAIENEAAGAMRAVALELTTASAQLSRDIERDSSRAGGQVAREVFHGDPKSAAAALTGLAPPFADPVLLAPDRSVLLLPPPSALPAAPPPAGGCEPRLVPATTAAKPS